MSVASCSPPTQGLGYRHTVLIMIWLLYMINYLDRMAVLTFLPFIQKDLALTPVQAGWLGSIFFLGYALAQFTSGFLTDKYGPKRIMGIAIWVFSGATFLTGFVMNFWQFMFLRLGLALGEGHHWTPALRMIANWFPAREKNRAYGFFATSWAIAPAITPLLVTTVAATFFDGAWKPIFFLLAIPGLLGVFLLYHYVYDSPREVLQKNRMTQEEFDYVTAGVGDDASVHGKTYSTKLFTKDAMFYCYIGAWCFLLMIFWGMNTWITTFLVMQHGMNIKTMGLFASLPYVMAIISNYLGGWLADKVFVKHPRIVPAIGFAACVPVLYFLGWIPKGETNLLILALALGGFCANLGWGMLSAYAALRYPKELVGRSQGIANGIGQFAAFLSPVIAGYLVVTNPDGSFNFHTVFIFWSVIALLATIFSLLLKETRVDHEKYLEEA